MPGSSPRARHGRFPHSCLLEKYPCWGGGGVWLDCKNRTDPPPPCPGKDLLPNDSPATQWKVVSPPLLQLSEKRDLLDSNSPPQSPGLPLFLPGSDVPSPLTLLCL
ncbi:UNVERIFIED_CONTAM: hypothetical protein K2H54_038971 [Gekko kuhli]